MQPQQQRARKAGVEPVAQQLAHRSDGERADLDLLQPSGADGALELGRRRSLVAATREQEEDRLLVQAARGEQQQPEGRRIEPLEVVDRDDDGALRGELPQRGQERDRERTQVGLLLALLQEKRDRERVPLRRRQRRQHHVVHSLQQVAERAEQQLHLGLRTRRAQDAIPARRRVGQRLLPEDRLADPGLARDHDRARADRQALERVPQLAELVVPTDHGPAPILIERRRSA